MPPLPGVQGCSCWYWDTVTTYHLLTGHREMDILPLWIWPTLTKPQVMRWTNPDLGSFSTGLMSAHHVTSREMRRMSPWGRMTSVAGSPTGNQSDIYSFFNSTVLTLGCQFWHTCALGIILDGDTGGTRGRGHGKNCAHWKLFQIKGSKYINEYGCCIYICLQVYLLFLVCWSHCASDHVSQWRSAGDIAWQAERCEETLTRCCTSSFIFSCGKDPTGFHFLTVGSLPDDLPDKKLASLCLTWPILNEGSGAHPRPVEELKTQALSLDGGGFGVHCGAYFWASAPPSCVSVPAPCAWPPGLSASFLR